MPLVIGHRGAAGLAPENTLPAFEMAARLGLAGVELDVQLTRDDVLVVCHDETVDRTSDGHGWVKDFTLAELKKMNFNQQFASFGRATIPTLAEVIDCLKPYGLEINVELKNSMIDYPDLEQKVVDLARSKDYLSHIIFSSFNHYSLMRVKAIDKSLYCGLLYEATPVRAWEYARQLGMDALHPQFCELYVPGDTCEEAHKAGIEVNTWTVNEYEDIRKCIEKGADRIISNYPDRVMELLKSRGV